MSPFESILKGAPYPSEWGDRFQEKLGQLVIAEKPLVVVETGVQNGRSTAHILRALQLNGAGVLHSVDPDHIVQITHPQWVFHKGLSRAVLPEILAATGPWDMFIHDSDHGYDNQLFEYEFAFSAVRSGGIIVTDDPYWAGPWGPKCAWHKFLTDRNSPGTDLGSASWYRKP